jgi:hypothetical protein
MLTRLGPLALGIAIAGCGPETDAGAVETARRPAEPMTRAAYAEERARVADSVIAATGTPEQLVRELGTGYQVGSSDLADSLSFLVRSGDCYDAGRRTDEYLAGAVTFVVDSAGPQIARTRWTSAAGNVVAACLGLAAKEWKLTSGARSVVQLPLRPR